MAMLRIFSLFINFPLYKYIDIETKIVLTGIYSTTNFRFYKGFSASKGADTEKNIGFCQNVFPFVSHKKGNIGIDISVQRNTI